MKTLKLLSILALGGLAACSADSITGTGPIDPGNPSGTYQAVSADGVSLPAQQSTTPDASGTTTTLQINSSTLSLLGDGSIDVVYQYTLSRKTASGATSVQGYVSHFVGSWASNGTTLQLTLTDLNTGLIVQFPGSISASNITVTTDFSVLIGVPTVFRIRYQP